jgi:death-on-curing protein
MRYLSLGQLMELHRRLIEENGGAAGIRDLGALESAVAQPKATFGQRDLYRSLAEKAAALCFSLAQNHPFMDGNKRVSHAAMETFPWLNGSELSATVDEQERLMLGLADGRVSREELTSWVRDHSRERA